MFDTLQDRLSETFKSLRGKRLSEADISETLREIRIALLEADVNLAVVKQFIAAVREKVTGLELSKSLNPSQQIIKIVNEELIEILGGEARRLRFAKQPPTVIMLAGLQGAGKTTLAGKLAHWLKEQGHAPLLVAADLQRPNAVNQLQVVGQRAGAHTFAPEPGNGVGDPVQVARDSIGYAKQKLHDVVIVDTAGRLGIDAEMMQQAIDIRNAVQPDEVLFVIDAMIGQDAVSTAQAFADGVGFDGVCLSKLDGDARGGAALSVARVTGKPIMFASNGEHIGDFDAFYPDRMASRILGMGDVLTLIEQAEKVFDEEESKAAAEKLVSGEGFGLDDFLAQMQQMRKMGPMSKILGMLPGMNQMKDQINQIDEKEIDRVEAIIFSMTPAERADVKILNGSRRARIARGAGVEVRDVNSLVKRFLEAKKMMQSMSGMMSGGAMPGPGGRMSKGPAKRTKQQAKKGAKRGKRPRPSAAPKKAPKAPSPADIEAAMGEFQLPPELAAMLDEQNRGPRQ